MPPVLAASEGAEEAALQPVRAELELAVRELAPREGNAIDLAHEMDEARTIAEALCAPAALS